MESTILLLIRALLWAAALIALAVSAATDLKHRIIRNESALVIAAVALVLHLISRPTLSWTNFLVVAAVVLAGLVILARYKFIGGGDAKLIGAVILLAPPERMPVLLIAIALAGGVLSLFYLIAHYALRGADRAQGAAVETGPAPNGPARWFHHEHRRIVAGEPMPYALAVLGGVTAYVAGELVQCFSGTSCSL